MHLEVTVPLFSSSTCSWRPWTYTSGTCASWTSSSTSTRCTASSIRCSSAARSAKPPRTVLSTQSSCWRWKSETVRQFDEFVAKIYLYSLPPDFLRCFLNKRNGPQPLTLRLNKMQRRYWTQEVPLFSIQEDQALKDIVSPMSEVNWTLVSLRMKAAMEGSDRNAKQCR